MSSNNLIAAVSAISSGLLISLSNESWQKSLTKKLLVHKETPKNLSGPFLT